MSKQGQTTEAHPKQQKQQKSKPKVTFEQIEELISVKKLSNSLGSSADDNHIQTHVAQLNNTRFQLGQRQAMAAQIGKLSGNQYLQRVMAQMRQNQDVESGVQPTDQTAGTAIESDTVQQGANSLQDSIQRNNDDDENPETQSEESPTQRTGIARIEEILSDLLVGPFDEAEIEEIWAGFGDNLPEMFAAHQSLWRRCMQRGADLDDLPQVEQVRQQFKTEVKALAVEHLDTNMMVIMDEMGRIGLTHTALGTELGTDMSSEGLQQQSQYLTELQQVARQIAQAQEAQRQLQGIEVGYDMEPDVRPGLISLLAGGPTPQEHAQELVARDGRENLGPTTFNPSRSPHHPPFGDESPPMADYQATKEHHDRLAALIAGLANRYPGAYAFVREGQVTDVAQAEDPQQARRIVGSTLQETLDNIHRTRQAIQSDDLDYRDLWPLHEQIFANSASDWASPFYQWVARDEVRGHERAEFWLNVGLGSLAAIGFLIANLVTAGTATFFIAAGVGIGAAGLQVARNWERYYDLATAAGTATSEETELVTGAQVDSALVNSIIESALLFIAAFGTASRLLRGARAVPAAQSSASLMRSARSSIQTRIEFFKRRLRDALRRNWRQEPLQSLDDAERGINQLFREYAEAAPRIQSGASLGMRELSDAQRRTLANEYMQALRTWRERALNLAHRKFAENSLVQTPGAGYGPRPLGGPPPRRPPSSHSGTGWENW